MPRTISDQQFDFYEQARGVADIALGLINDPQLGHEAKALLKRKHPQYRDAEFDLRNEFNEKLAADRKEREDAVQAKVQAEEREHIKKTREEVQKQYGFTEEAMKDLEAWMEKELVANYEVAASYKAAKEPRATDGGIDSMYWRFEKQPDADKIRDDPEGWGSSEILAAIRRDQDRIRQGGR